MVAWTQGAISMGPIKMNRQGGQILFMLTTTKVVVCQSWTVIPMPNTVVTQIGKLAGN